MADVYVVRNQLGHYWGKGKAWVDGTEPKAVLRVKHEDEAVNTLFELSSKDTELRGEILAVELSNKGNPVIEPSEHLLPKDDDSEKGAAQATTAAEESTQASAGSGEEPNASTALES